MPNNSLNFAANLRRLRKEAGLTQAELARKIDCSEKSVSKWECAAGIPDIACLLALARQLQVSVDALFADNTVIYYLGIDGGGTKTAFLLTDSNGNEVRKIYTDSSNPMDIGLDACKRVLREGIYRVCDGIDIGSVVAFAGIAGCTSVKEQLQAFLDTLPLRFAACDSDNANFMAAGLGEMDGITLILGTGICAWARLEGKTYRTGGWGYLINEGGSAFDIGQDALKYYYSWVDGNAQPGYLTECIARIYDDDAALLRQTYAGGKKWIASLAPLVFEAFRAGDEAATAIISRNIAVAAKVIETAARRFSEGPVRVVMAGGLTNQPDITSLLRKAFTDPNRIDLRILDAEPVTGAVYLARKMLNDK